MDYPFLDFFNYVIVAAEVGQKIILLDATDPVCSFDIIPSRCLNERGLIINKENPEWVYFNNTVESGVYHQFDLSFNPNLDTLSANVSMKTTAYEALNFRNEYLQSKDNFKKMVASGELTVPDSVNLQDLEDVEQPLKIKFTTSAGFETVEDKILVSPFCGKAIDDNPFKQTSRSYPIDMLYKKSRYFTSTIHIPKGYKIAVKPEEYTTNNQLVLLQYKVMTTDSTCTVTGLYKLKKEVYDAGDYNYLKSCYTKIIEKFNEKIILARTDSNPLATNKN